MLDLERTKTLCDYFDICCLLLVLSLAAGFVIAKILKNGVTNTLKPRKRLLYYMCIYSLHDAFNTRP